MGFLVVCLAVIVLSAVVGVVRVRVRQARLTRDTRAWVQFLREDLSWLVATVEVSSATRRVS